MDGKVVAKNIFLITNRLVNDFAFIIQFTELCYRERGLRG